MFLFCQYVRSTQCASTYRKTVTLKVPVIPLKLSMDARVEFKKGNQHVCEVTLEDIGVDGLNFIFSIAKWEGKDSHDGNMHTLYTFILVLLCSQ
jgi:hypothetical protein